MIVVNTRSNMVEAFVLLAIADELRDSTEVNANATRTQLQSRLERNRQQPLLLPEDPSARETVQRQAMRELALGTATALWDSKLWAEFPRLVYAAGELLQMDMSVAVTMYAEGLAERLRTVHGDFSQTQDPDSRVTRAQWNANRETLIRKLATAPNGKDSFLACAFGLMREHDALKTEAVLKLRDGILLGLVAGDLDETLTFVGASEFRAVIREAQMFAHISSTFEATTPAVPTADPGPVRNRRAAL